VDEKQKANLLKNMREIAQMIEKRQISPRESASYIMLWHEQLGEHWGIF
jgi:hypothetical protein